LVAIVSIALSFTIFELFDVQNIVTLKSWLRATQGHWKLCHSKACVRFPIRIL